MTAPLPSASDLRAASSSLNGFWERGRRLLRLLGSQWDERVQPVIIVADSREPGGLPQSYRRFSLVMSGAVHAANSRTSILCEALDGVVLDSIAVTHGTLAAGISTNFRTLTPNQVAADGVAYTPIAVASLNVSLAGAFTDSPAAGLPPFSVYTGLVNPTAGNPFAAVPHVTDRATDTRFGLFLPFGAALNIHYPQATTLEVINIRGYLR